MAINLKPADIPDVVTTCLAEYPEKGDFEVAYALEDYTHLDEWFTNNRMDIQSGEAIEAVVVLDESGNARHVGLYETDEFNDIDVTKKTRVEWCGARNYVTYHENRITMNKGWTKLADYVKTQFFTSYVALANVIERRAPMAPNSATDTKNPYGVLYWLGLTTPGTVNYVFGFNGTVTRFGDGSTTNVIGGVSTDNPLWRAGCLNYDGEIDLPTARAMQDAVLRGTRWKRPRSIKEIDKGTRKRKWRIMSSYAQYSQYMTLVNEGPDNRNRDLNPFSEMLTFMGIGWEPCAAYDDLPYSPVCCVDLNQIYPVVQEGWWLRETDPIMSANQAWVWRQVVECRYNYRCKNRRELGFVMNTPT